LGQLEPAYSTDGLMTPGVVPNRDAHTSGFAGRVGASGRAPKPSAEESLTRKGGAAYPGAL
jgi:hypothetical protein